MYRGTQLPPAGDIWRELQKRWNSDENRRVADDEAERRFWKQYMSLQGQNGPDAYSAKIWDCVKQILGERYYSSITEIGPGWGNYTFNLAECCRHLTCVDISPTVLHYIKETGIGYGFQIQTENNKWEDYDGKTSEVVFGFNCFYRMRNIEECLAKIDKTGTELRIIGMTSGPEQEFLVDFEKELGLPVRYHRLDYIVLVNVLYQLGIDCNVRIVNLEKEYVFPSADAAARKFANRIMTPNYDIECLRKIMKRYLHKGGDGLLHYTHHFKSAIIYW